MALPFLSGCFEEKTPSRDQIPIIKEKIARLQKGIQEHNLAAIDSLLSVDILKKHLSSDSLLKFVYGPSAEKSFESFGTPEIVYTDEFARVESYLNDSTSDSTRPVTFMFTYANDQWLLIDFKTGHSGSSE